MSFRPSKYRPVLARSSSFLLAISSSPTFNFWGHILYLFVTSSLSVVINPASLKAEVTIAAVAVSLTPKRWETRAVSFKLAPICAFPGLFFCCDGWYKSKPSSLSSMSLSFSGKQCGVMVLREEDEQGMSFWLATFLAFLVVIYPQTYQPVSLFHKHICYRLAIFFHHVGQEEMHALGQGLASLWYICIC